MKFALNAQPLPNDPSQYVAGVSYKSDVSDDLINKGVTSGTFLETSQLNSYLYELSVTVEHLLEKNIPVYSVLSKNRYVTYEPQDNDLCYYDGNLSYSKEGFRPVIEIATTAKQGLIEKILIQFSPPEIPIATTETKGLINPSSLCLKRDFYNVDTVRIQNSGESDGYGLFFIFGQVTYPMDRYVRLSTYIRINDIINSARDSVLLNNNIWL